MNGDASIEEAGYDRRRLTQWLAGRAHGNGMPRRDLFRLSAGFALAAVPARLGMPPVGRETASAPDTRAGWLALGSPAITQLPGGAVICTGWAPPDASVTVAGASKDAQ